MDPKFAMYIAYLVITVGLTVWVGRTLSRNGHVFLIDVFAGSEKLARSVNHLLVVGFYLVNLGYVSIALKVGAVVLVLGVLHLGNLYVLNKLRRRAQQSAWTDARPPVAPDAVWGNVLPGRA